MTTRYYEERECAHGRVERHGDAPDVEGHICPGGQRRELTDVEEVEWCEEHDEHASYWRGRACHIGPSSSCSVVLKLLINPPTEEE